MRIITPATLDSKIFLIHLFVSHVIFPVFAGSLILVQLMTGTADDNIGDVIVQSFFILCFMGGAAFGYSYLRGLSINVTMDSERRIMNVGERSWTIDGSERCELKIMVSAYYLRIKLKDNTVLRWLPTAACLRDIKRLGPQQWWDNVTSGEFD